MLRDMVRRQRPRGLSTLLFTDIVGSTEISVELGDERWRFLQARHHAMIRRELKRSGGHEVDTAGDGFFATFDTPAAGVRCAAAVVSGARGLGLDIRAGLHIGEVELAGEKVTGIAVTTAARVKELAGPGQVLVTATIAQMVAGSDLGFDRIGPRELKGVPGTWELYSLSSVGSTTVELPLDPNDAVQAREHVSPRRDERQRNRMVFPAIAVGALVLIAAGALALARPSATPTPTPPSSQVFAGAAAVRLDMTDSSLLPIDIPNVPYDVSAGPVVLTRPGGLSGLAFAWILSNVPARPGIELTQINRASGQPVDHVLARGCSPPRPCVVPADGRVWLTVSSARPGVVEGGIAVEGIDVTGAKKPRLLAASSKTQLSSVTAMVYGEHALWIGDTLLGLITQIDLRTGERHEYRVPGSVDSLAFGDGSLWVVDRFGGLLRRFDASARRWQGHTGLQGDPASVAVGGDYVWVTDGFDDLVEKIPVALQSSHSTIPVGGQPVAVVYAEGAVWVANHDDGTVSKIDPVTDELLATYPVEIHPSSIAVSGNEVWVTGNPSGVDRS
jgi:YVTN family beta-propeller protein